MSSALDRFAAFIDGMAREKPQPERGTHAAAAPEPDREPKVGDHHFGSHQSTPADRQPLERAEPPHEPEPTTESSRPDEMLTRAFSETRGKCVEVPPWGEPTDTPPAAEHLVQRLAAALAKPRPWQRATDPELALRYFEGRAKQMLAIARDPVALVEHEERLAVEPGVRRG
jgi:hypothetical protein